MSPPRSHRLGASGFHVLMELMACLDEVVLFKLDPCPAPGSKSDQMRVTLGQFLNEMTADLIPNSATSTWTIYDDCQVTVIPPSM